MRIIMYFLFFTLIGFLLVFYFFQEDITSDSTYDDVFTNEEKNNNLYQSLIGTISSTKENRIYLNTDRGYVWVTVPKEVADINSFQVGEKIRVEYDQLLESDPATTTAIKIIPSVRIDGREL